MDIVLQIFDTFLFDRFYATFYPASSMEYTENAVKQATSTFSSMREMPTAIHSTTQFFNLAPSQYAYMSQWPRDSAWRQFVSLYLITWYGNHCSLYQSLHPRKCANTLIGYSASSSISSAPPSLTSSSLTTPLSLIPNISRTKSSSRFAKP